MSQNFVILHTLLCPTSYEILTDNLQICLCVVITHVGVPVYILKSQPLK